MLLSRVNETTKYAEAALKHATCLDDILLEIEVAQGVKNCSLRNKDLEVYAIWNAIENEIYNLARRRGWFNV